MTYPPRLGRRPPQEPTAERTLAASSLVARNGPSEQHAMRDPPPPSTGRPGSSMTCPDSCQSTGSWASEVLSSRHRSQGHSTVPGCDLDACSALYKTSVRSTPPCHTYNL